MTWLIYISSLDIADNWFSRSSLGAMVGTLAMLSRVAGLIPCSSSYSDETLPVGSMSQLEFGSSQVRFPCQAPFTSCQLLLKV